MRKALLLLLVPFVLQAQAQNFTSGNLVLYRVGTGSAALSSAATAVFLDEYTTSGSLVQSLAMPTAASGSNRPLTSSGTASSEGLLSRSADGNYLLVTGYGAAPGTASIAGTASAAVPRVAGLVDNQRNINTSTALSDMASGNNIRSAASTDGTNIWVSGGAGGIRYTVSGSTTSTQINSSGTNFRSLAIQGGQLYVSSGSGTVRVASVGTGTPTGTGQTITNVNGYPTTGTSPYQFQFFDLDASIPGYDVLYVADDGLGLQKFSLVSGTWTLNGTIGASSDQYRGLIGAQSGSTVTLYAVRKGSELVTVADASGYNGTLSGSANLLATAAANTGFRGIAFAPGAAAGNPTLTFGSGSPLLLPPAVGAVVSDPTDPLSVKGVVVNVLDNGTAIPAANYTLTGTSSNTGVIPNANISITKADGKATIKAVATGVGYTDITLTLTANSVTRTITLNVAASAAAAAPANTRFHSGASDASAAIALDDRYMVVADDEMNRLFVYNRDSSGLPATSFDFSGLLSLTDLSGGVPREVDVEAGVRGIAFPNRLYWLGSMSNSASSAAARPNRNRLFAVTATGTGSATAFAYVGMYTGLRQDLISWGDANGYNFTAAAAPGKDPKAIDGFNVEGLTLAPDNTTAYIAFRAPLVPTGTSGTKAVLALVQNFESWFNNGAPAGSPALGAPIELDLNGRGFRDIVRLSNGNYVILAGNYDDAPLNPAIYLWTGLAANAPTQLSSLNTSGLNPEAVLEIRSGGVLQADRLQVLSDNGDYIYYNDGVAAKDLTQNNFKKFGSDILISGTGSVLPLQLIEFSVVRNNGASLLSWQVSGSGNGERFVIERSVDGRSFSAISGLNAQPGQDRYSFSDAISLEGRLYYRLAQVEASGRTVYSAIRVVSAAPAAVATIYPNPVVNGKATVMTGVSGVKYALVLDAAGHKMRELSFSSNTVDVSLNGLPAGTYYLVLSTKTQIVATESFAIR